MPKLKILKLSQISELHQCKRNLDLLQEELSAQREQSRCFKAQIISQQKLLQLEGEKGQQTRDTLALIKGGCADLEKQKIAKQKLIKQFEARLTKKPPLVKRVELRFKNAHWK